MIGCLHMFQWPPVCLDAPYVWIPPYVWMPLYVWTPSYVWMSLIPLDATIHLAASKHTEGQPNIWRASKHTGGIQTWGISNHTQGCPNIRGTQTYGGNPNMRGVQTWGCQNIQVSIQTYRGCPNIGWHLNIQGTPKHTGGIQMYGAYGQPLSLTKHAFFVLCMCRRHPNIWGHMDTSVV